jgi:tungstate transport system ATP-binding protein
VGPSGAGKSTLLRLLNFLETPDQGHIVYGDCEFGPGDTMGLAQRRQVTTVFQRPLLLNRSVRKNVAFGLNLRGERHDPQVVERALERVGLADRAHQRARTLSGGEAQRVALARAMVIQPRVLLLDEPTANLDPYNVGLIEDIVRQVNHEQGGTVVLVTHNVFQAQRLAHRVGLLLEGSLIEVAPADAFFHAPRDPRTAAFVQGHGVLSDIFRPSSIWRAFGGLFVRWLSANVVLADSISEGEEQDAQNVGTLCAVDVVGRLPGRLWQHSNAYRGAGRDGCRGHGSADGGSAHRGRAHRGADRGGGDRSGAYGYPAR